MIQGQRHQLIAVLFGILGAATIAFSASSIILSRAGPPALVAASFLYGLAALLTAYGLWRRSKLAPRAFLAWCATIVVFMAAFFREEPDAADPYLIPSFVLLAGVLYLGWRYISRICARAA